MSFYEYKQLQLEEWELVDWHRLECSSHSEMSFQEPANLTVEPSVQDSAICAVDPTVQDPAEYNMAASLQDVATSSDRADATAESGISSPFQIHQEPAEESLQDDYNLSGWVDGWEAGYLAGWVKGWLAGEWVKGLP